MPSINIQNFEWIIVDDCSNDDSYNLIVNLAKNHKNIKVLKTNKNSRSAVARNIGLKNATGKYITFLDSDDLFDPNYLEEQVKFIKENGPIISCGYRRMAEHTTNDFFVPEEADCKRLLKVNPLFCLSTMYDREIIRDVYFSEDYARCEDCAFWLNILKKGYFAKGNPKVLATYRIGKNAKSSNKFKLIKHMYRVYHESQHLLWFKEIQKC